MSRINDILDAVQTRAETITGVRTVAKRKRQFQQNELDAAAVYRDTTDLVDEVAGRGQVLSVPVVVEYHRSAEGVHDPAAVAETMVESVLAAVETDDELLGGLLCDPITFGADSVTLPEDSGEVITVSVLFSCRFVRPWGGFST